MEKAYKGVGCAECNQTGYQGRTAVFEIILVDNKLQELIAKRAPMDDLKVYAREQKMRMLREEVLDLINQGLTTVEEGVRILYTVD